MAEQEQIQKKILPALSLLTSEENLKGLCYLTYPYVASEDQALGSSRYRRHITNSWEICRRCAKILLAAEHKIN